MKSEIAPGLNEIKQAIGSLSRDQRRELTQWLLWGRFETRPADTPLKRAVFATLFGLAIFIAAEAFFFHSGWYNKYLEPDSTAGQIEYRLFWQRRMAPPKVPDVLVIGDSRIAEGFSSRAAAASLNGAVHFVNFGMPGSSPRVWYYTLRDVDKDRNRFAAIVIALDRYSDIDGLESLRDRPMDLNYLAGRLRLSDCWDFSRSFSKSALRREVLTGCMVRGIVLRPDVLGFLSDIPGRLKRTKDWRDNGAGYIDGYGGKPEQLTGLTFDPATHDIHFPDGAKDWQIATVKATLNPGAAPQTGEQTAYRRRWIGGILDLYRNSATRVVFLQLPNAPLPLPDSPVPARFLQSVASRPRLTVLPPDRFRNLQHPDLFADGLHLNAAGRRLFSDQIAHAIEPLVR